MPLNGTETRQNTRRQERARNIEEKTEKGRETVDTMAKPDPPLMMAWAMWHSPVPSYTLAAFFHISYVNLPPNFLLRMAQNQCNFSSSESLSRTNAPPAGPSGGAPPPNSWGEAKISSSSQQRTVRGQYTVAMRWLELPSPAL